MHPLIRQHWPGYIRALAGVGLVTTLYSQLITEINSTTVALSFLLVVQLIASTCGLGPAIMASTLGVICFNFFFLPPTGTFHIKDPQNWVALSAFLVTAVIASQLSSAVRRRARDAERRREDVWKLYQFSRAIIATPDSETVTGSIARQVHDIFGVEYCAVFGIDREGGWRQLALSMDSQPAFEPSRQIMDEAFNSGELELFDQHNNKLVTPASDRTGHPHIDNPVVSYTPLKIGVKPTGVLVLRSATLEGSIIEAIASLVALALERARFLREVSRTEALRQSDELKSALLASVSHDLRTPLTSMRAAIDSLLQQDIDWDKAALREFHLIISEDVHRLTRVVENLLEMARIEAGELRLWKQWEALPDVINDVIARCAAFTCNHSINACIREGLPLVKIDSRLISEALTHLVENAGKYSSPDTEILIRGDVDENQLTISVTDQGPGIAPEEQNRIFEKFYRSRRPSQQRSAGTGMGLAIARGIVEAHEGKISVESALGSGSTFTLVIPVESRSVTDQLPDDNQPGAEQ
jgi:two-component system, OmpR family, sensor histidine kinase KdpD